MIVDIRCLKTTIQSVDTLLLTNYDTRLRVNANYDTRLRVNANYDTRLRVNANYHLSK